MPTSAGGRMDVTVPSVVVVAAAVVVLAVHPNLSSGPLPLWAIAVVDEIGHVATATILVASWPFSMGRWVILTALATSILIDLDHTLQYMGIDALTEGTARPYPHSLATPALAFAVAAALRGLPREVAVGTGAGVLAHLLRDLATGPGVSLFWPLSDTAVRMPWVLYAAIVAVLTAFAWSFARQLPQTRELKPKKRGPSQ